MYHVRTRLESSSMVGLKVEITTYALKRKKDKVTPCGIVLLPSPRKKEVKMGKI